MVFGLAYDESGIVPKYPNGTSLAGGKEGGTLTLGSKSNGFQAVKYR